MVKLTFTVALLTFLLTNLVFDGIQRVVRLLLFSDGTVESHAGDKLTSGAEKA